MKRPTSSYEHLADRSAAVVDAKPHNAYSDRRAMLSLLPLSSLRCWQRSERRSLLAPWTGTRWLR